MPCNSDYMEANFIEREISRVYCLLEEAKTGQPVDSKSSEWQGYHPKVYNKNVTKKQADGAVAKLCGILAKSKDVTKYSLEMQMWWREHQAADKKRREKELSESKEKELAEQGLQKLTEAEVAALKKWLLK